MNNANLKDQLCQIFINSAELVDYKQADDSKSKCLLVKIPYRSLVAYRKVSEKVLSHLEQKFNWPVIVVGTRTIISKKGKPPIYLASQLILSLGKAHKTQKRPRSRTLTTVHNAILEDIVLYIIYLGFIINYKYSATLLPSQADPPELH